MIRWSRRRLLCRLGPVGIGGLSGCIGEDQDQTAENDSGGVNGQEQNTTADSQNSSTTATNEEEPEKEDIDENTEETEIPESVVLKSQLDSPTAKTVGMAWNGEGFWVVGLDTSDAVLIAPDGTWQETFELSMALPRGIEIDGEHIWVCSNSSHRIYKFTFDGEPVIDFPAPAQTPEDMAWDGTHMYVSTRDDEKIYRLTSEGEITHALNPPEPGNIFFGGIAFDGNNLWITKGDGPTEAFSSDEKVPIITKMTTDGDFLESYDYELHGGSSTNPAGLTWDGNHLWVAEMYSDTLYELEVP